MLPFIRANDGRINLDMTTIVSPTLHNLGSLRVDAFCHVELESNGDTVIYIAYKTEIIVYRRWVVFYQKSTGERPPAKGSSKSKGSSRGSTPSFVHSLVALSLQTLTG